MNELALFAGAGGGILGGQLLGWRTVCAVEINPYAASVLAARQNDGLLPPFPIWDDVCTFDGHPWRGRVDVVSGGFPCQDISAAGKGEGIEGKRSGLWVEMARIIREVQPEFVYVENSPRLTSRGLGKVLGDLAEMGFDAQWGVLGAADVGAPHQRDRIWIVANSGIKRRLWRSEAPGWEERAAVARYPGSNVAYAEGIGCWPGLCETVAERIGAESRDKGGDVADPACNRGDQRRAEPEVWAGKFEIECGCPSMADTQSERCAEARQLRHNKPSQWVACRGKEDQLPNTSSERPPEPEQKAVCGTRGRKEGRAVAQFCGWATEPDVGRVAHGVAARVDRLTAIGNGQVPECHAEAFRMLTSLPIEELCQ